MLGEIEDEGDTDADGLTLGDVELLGLTDAEGDARVVLKSSKTADVADASLA